jgi:hypothetical protein
MKPPLFPSWCHLTAPANRTTAEGGLAATPILDWRHARLLRLAAEVQDTSAETERELLITAHRLIGARVRPVYAMNDEQPASRTLTLERGSCSQRLALLEAVARACGIAGRVRGLLVDGRFWHSRFPRLRPLGVTCSSCDLPGYVRADLGHFDSRDALFRTHGQTLCMPVRMAVDLITSRRAA